MFSYDGNAFSYPHATKCRSTITAHSGKTYQIADVCSALGDGTPTKPSTLNATYTVESSTRIEVRKPGRAQALRYRWCGPR